MTRITPKGEEEEIIIPLPPKKVLGFALVPDAVSWRRWLSLRWMAVSAVLQAVSEFLTAVVTPARDGWAFLPQAWADSLPGWLPQAFGLAAIVALAGAGLARFIQQQATPPPPPNQYDGRNGNGYQPIKGADGSIPPGADETQRHIAAMIANSAHRASRRDR